jgi:apurinic endonuclease APN1
MSIGSHVKFAGSIVDTVEESLRLGCSSIQFFLGSNLSYARSSLKLKDVETFNSKSFTLPVFTHLPYVYNLAGSIKHKSLAWSGDLETDKKIQLTIAGIQSELNSLDLLKGPSRKGCVLHIGASPSSKTEGLDAVAQTINQLKIPSDTYLILETMVGRGHVLGTTFADLQSVIKKCSQAESIKVCIDTCHIFANGSYRLHTEDDVEKLFTDFSSWFELKDLALFHLNDSKAEFGSKVDKHAYIGTGYIWSSAESRVGYKHLLQKANSWNVPMVLETSVEDLQNAKNIFLA